MKNRFTDRKARQGVEANKKNIATLIDGGIPGGGGGGVYIGTEDNPPPPGSNYVLWAIPEDTGMLSPAIHYDVSTLTLENKAKVNYVPDLSGNGYHLINEEEERLPTFYAGGRPFIQFNGTSENSYLEAQFAEWDESKREKFTMFFVADIRSSASTNQYVSIGVKAASSLATANCPGVIKTSTGALKLSINEDSNGSVTVDASAFLTNEMTLTVLAASFDYSTGKVVFYRNTELLGESTYNAKLNPQSALRIAKTLYTDEKSTPIMKFREFLYYHEAFTSSQIVAKVQELLQKWSA